MTECDLQNVFCRISGVELRVLKWSFFVFSYQKSVTTLYIRYNRAVWLVGCTLCRNLLGYDKVRGAFNKFPDFFVQGFKIVVDSWKFTMLLLYILWDGWLICMISGSKEQLQQELEYTILKPDCQNWWISKMKSGLEEEGYAIKFYFKLRKMPQKRMECFRLLLEHLTWTKHQFLSCIRDSRKAGSLWEKMRGVGGVRKSIHHS